MVAPVSGARCFKEETGYETGDLSGGAENSGRSVQRG